MATWRDGSSHKAEIVERRPSHAASFTQTHTKPQSKAVSSAGAGDKDKEEEEEEEEEGGEEDVAQEKDVADNFMYYVHYVGYDRRLDEWVDVTRLDLPTVERVPKSKSPSSHGRTRNNKRRPSDAHGSGSNDPAVLKLEREHEELTKVKNIGCIQIGEFEVDTWYYSPYPDEYCGVDRLYVCEVRARVILPVAFPFSITSSFISSSPRRQFCLKYMKNKKTYNRHRSECTCIRPPGDEIYREGNVCVYEIDGKKEPMYCQR